MIAEDADEQLDLFRKKISRQAKVQVLAMFALSDPGHLDKQQSAKISDIAEVMGYQRRDKTGRFHWQLYQDIEDTGLRLRRDQISLFISSPAGKTKDGRRKTRYEVIDMTLLQEFGFYYEDDDGQPIDLINPPRHKQKGLIPYSAPESDKPPIWAMPLVNDKGQLVLNKDGTTRRRPAGGVTWWWASRFVRMARAKKTNWVFYRNAVEKLRRYLADPAT